MRDWDSEEVIEEMRERIQRLRKGRVSAFYASEKSKSKKKPKKTIGSFDDIEANEGE